MVNAIGDYAMIGDTRTAALVDRQGSIDWMCLPRFDSDPVFGRLIDRYSGGHFSVGCHATQDSGRYYDGTTLITRWKAQTGELELRDTMVTDVSNRLLPSTLLVRRITCTHGRALAILEFAPKLGMPGVAPRVEADTSSVRCTWGGQAIAVTSDLGLPLVPSHPLRLSLSQGESRTIAMSVSDKEPLIFVQPGEAARLAELDATWWKQWSDSLEYEGPQRDAVIKSFLVLRLLTYSPSGAPVAAPTTSLPEWIGSGRNWDYRFSWPRDASIGIRGFLEAGEPEVARAFLRWLLHASRVTRPRLQVLYTLDGNPGPEEREVEVSGFAGSTPVRVGNGATDQVQHDIYGWVLEAVARLIRAGESINKETARAMSAAAKLVTREWSKPDNGIWEVRDEPRHYVHSKMMSWIALDGAIRSSRVLGEQHVERWSSARDEIANDIRKHGLDEERSTYLRSYGSKDLDASVLLPLTQFEQDPRLIRSTISAIRKELSAGGPLLYRYRCTDGQRGPEGAFLPCTFWLVHALASSGQVSEAEDMFAEACSLANDVGLLPEELDPSTGDFLGNYPQALTHGSLVLAAQALAKARSDEPKPQG